MPTFFSGGRRSRGIRLAAQAGVMCVLVSAVAEAQTRTPSTTERMRGPFAGLFGGGVRAENSQSLQLRSSIFGVYQVTRLPNEFDRTLLDPRFQETQAFAGLSSTLAYNFSRQSGPRSFSVGLGAFASVYSVSLDDPQLGSYGSLSYAAPLTSRISFNSSGVFSYGGVYQFSPFSGGGIQAGGGSTAPIGTSPFGDPTIAPGLNMAGLALQAGTVSGQGSLRATLTRRSSLTVGTQYNRMFFPSRPESELSSIFSNASFSYRLYRKLSLIVTYQRQEQLNATGPAMAPLQDVMAMLNYGDALTLNLSRRTTLSMSVSAGSARSYQGQNQLQLLGSATMNHSMGRTWNSGLAYARTLGFSAGFNNAILFDTATASFGGQISQRVSLTGMAAYGRGYVGLDMDNSFDTVTANTVLRTALTRRIAPFVQYSYYESRIPVGTSTLPLLSNYRGHTALVGLSLFAPLYNKPRVRQ